MYSPFDLLSVESWILLISVVVLLRWYIHKQWRVLKDLNIPHPKPSIFKVGNFGDTARDFEAFFEQDLENKKKWGMVFGSYIGLQPRVCINDPDILKQVFIKEAGVFRDRQKNFTKLNGKEMNTALTAATGDQWKRIRNTLSPTFSTSKLKDMFLIFAECTEKMVESLNKIVDEKEGRFFTKEIFGKLSMDLICSAAFGVNVHSQKGESELVTRTQKFFAGGFFGVLTMLVMLFPFLETLLANLGVSMFKRKDIDYYNRLIDRIIENKKAAKGEARADIMQAMLTSEISEEDVKNGADKGLTRTEIIGNSLIMIFAGYETTANTLIFFSYCVAQEPEVQEKMFKEIIETKKKYDGLTYEAINSMKYLDMCMKESQRLYGAAPRNSRYTDVEVTVKGITIPADSHVDIPVYGLHHDEEYWEDPYKFMPERFDDMSKIDPMVFQPFGAGPRNCIGMRFAILEVKMAMCKLLYNFKLETCDDTPKPPLKAVFRGSMAPKEDLYLKVSRRPKVDDVSDGPAESATA